MKRRVPAIVAPALAAAMTLAFSPGAHAAAKPSIRTYTEQGGVNFIRVGTEAGYYSRTWGSEKVELSPRMAFNDSWHSAFRFHGVHTSAGRLDIAGGRSYTRTGSGRWTVRTLTARQRRIWAQELNPYVTVVKFRALPGVHRLAARHYRARGTYATIGSFLAWEFSVRSAAFKGSGIKAFILDLWTDPSGRPVKIAVSARSSTVAFSAAEAFARYNKPVVIKIP